MKSIRPIGPSEHRACERVLRSLPRWFGIESALVQYVEDCQSLPTWVGSCDETICGFATIRRHFAGAAEIHCIAVQPDLHRCGVGRALVGRIEQELRADHVQFLQVKTLGPSRSNAEYDRTRRFYEAIGFVPLEEFPKLWPGNPALQMVKRI